MEWEYFKFFAKINPEFKPFYEGFSKESREENGNHQTIIHVEPNQRHSIMIFMSQTKAFLGESFLASKES
jgi:hypothetical protein